MSGKSGGEPDQWLHIGITWETYQMLMTYFISLGSRLGHGDFEQSPGDSNVHSKHLESPELGYL